MDIYISRYRSYMRDHDDVSNLSSLLLILTINEQYVHACVVTRHCHRYTRCHTDVLPLLLCVSPLIERAINTQSMRMICYDKHARDSMSVDTTSPTIFDIHDSVNASKLTISDSHAQAHAIMGYQTDHISDDNDNIMICMYE